jgi:DNA-binding response OmpR family regulator
MNKLNILVIGRHQEIMKTLFTLVNKMENCVGFSALTDEDAIKIFNENNIDLVLLSSGIPEESEQLIRNIFTDKNPNIKIIQHYGGGSGLLSNEIMEAMYIK